MVFLQVCERTSPFVKEAPYILLRGDLSKTSWSYAALKINCGLNHWQSCQRTHTHTHTMMWLASFKAWFVEGTLKEAIKTQEGAPYSRTHSLYIRYLTQPITMRDTDAMTSRGDERSGEDWVNAEALLSREAVDSNPATCSQCETLRPCK